jgi:hypothetical protein
MLLYPFLVVILVISGHYELCFSWLMFTCFEFSLISWMRLSWNQSQCCSVECFCWLKGAHPSRVIYWRPTHSLRYLGTSCSQRGLSREFSTGASLLSIVRLYNWSWGYTSLDCCHNADSSMDGFTLEQLAHRWVLVLCCCLWGKSTHCVLDNLYSEHSLSVSCCLKKKKN